MSTDCGVPTAEEPVQRWRNRYVGILMLPGVITGSPRAINAVGGGLVEKPERVKLCLGDGHSLYPMNGQSRMCYCGCSELVGYATDDAKQAQAVVSDCMAIL